MESEYVCYPNPYVNRRVRSRAEWLMIALLSLAEPSEEQLAHPWYQKASAPAHLAMIRFVAGGFCRLKFDSKFDLWRPSRSRKPDWIKQRKLIDVCVPLWAKTWQVLEEMNSLGTLPPPPFASVGTIHPLTEREALAPLWFMLLVLEGEFLTPWADDLPDGSSGFNTLLKQQQSDNRALHTFNNPYEAPYTRLFIKSAIATVDKFDRFRKDFYNPMVRQRQSVTALIKKERFVAIDLDGKHRGGYGQNKAK